MGRQRCGTPGLAASGESCHRRGRAASSAGDPTETSPPSKLQLLAGLEHGRTIPVAEYVGQCRLGPLSEVGVHDQLPFGRMAGNMTLACRILHQNDPACANSADITIARLKFHLAREPDHKLTARRVVPIHLAHARRYAADNGALKQELNAVSDAAAEWRRGGPRSS